MIKKIIFIAVILFAVIFSIGWYLRVDDFVGCAIQPSNLEGCGTSDAIVAISGGDTAGRTKQAIELYQNGWADLLIMSGDARDDNSPSNASIMRQQAIDAGVPEFDIIIDELAETTNQNAQNLKTVFEQNQIESIILVTSNYHQRRASQTFDRFTDLEDIRNYPTNYDKDWGNYWWFNPRSWYLAISEIFRILVLNVLNR